MVLYTWSHYFKRDYNTMMYNYCIQMCVNIYENNENLLHYMLTCTTHTGLIYIQCVY